MKCKLGSQLQLGSQLAFYELIYVRSVFLNYGLMMT